MPGPIGVSFGGAQIIRPGVSVRVDASAMVPSQIPSGKTILAAGTSDGGDPSKVYEFSSYADAASVLRAGDALALLARMFAPSPDQSGAGLVRFQRVGSPVAASLTAAGVVFTAEDFGRHTNGISIQISVNAGNAAAWDVVVRKRADGYARTYTVGLGLSVTSTATTPKIVFDHVNREAKLYENAASVATFPYPTDLVTIAQLSAWINGRTGWTSTVAGDPSMPVSYMDNPLLAAAPAITASATNIPASQGALVWLLNTRDAQVNAALQTPGTYAALSVQAETALAGGAGTSLDVVTSTDWQKVLTNFESVDGQYLFLATTDPTVQALGNQHAVTVSTLSRKRWRVFVAGGAAGQSYTAAAAQASALDGSTSYCWNGSLVVDPGTGVQKQYGGLGFAAQVCGMCGGLPDCEPLTNKAISADALENPVLSDAVVNALLTAGVTVAALDPIQGGTRIVQALTTYQSGANPLYRTLQGLRIQYHLCRGEQAVLAPLVGQPFDLETGSRAKKKLEAYYDSEVRTATNTEGVLTRSTTDGKAWKNLSVMGSTDIGAWLVDVEAHAVGETDYVLVSNHLTPAVISL